MKYYLSKNAKFDKTYKKIISRFYREINNKMPHGLEMSNDISGLVKVDEKEKIKFEKKGARFL